MKILVLLAILLLAPSCHGDCLETIKVFSGDTCQSINDNNPNDISMDEFMALNPGIDCNSLEPGSQVCIAGDLPVSDSNGNSDQEPSSDGDVQNSSDQEQSSPSEQSDQEQEPTSDVAGQNSSDQEQSNPPEATEEEQENSSDNQEIPSDAEVVIVSDAHEVSPIEAEPTSSEAEQSPTEAVVIISDEESSPSEVEPTASEQEPSPSEEESTPIPTDAEEYDPFIQEVIAAHQYYRNFFGSPPLVWNYTLNASALSWVEYCMSINTFAHSVDLGAGSKYGENIGLLAGYYIDQTGHHSVSFNATQIINALIGSEWKNFINGSVIFDDSDSVTGSWQNIGHFTQAIWKNTTSVGCGITSSGDTTALVCQYYPPGNGFGERIY